MLRDSAALWWICWRTDVDNYDTITDEHFQTNTGACAQCWCAHQEDHDTSSEHQEQNQQRRSQGQQSNLACAAGGGDASDLHNTWAGADDSARTTKPAAGTGQEAQVQVAAVHDKRADAGWQVGVGGTTARPQALHA